MSDSSPFRSVSPSLSPAPLPRPLSSFIGRAAEIEELRDLLARSRLLTLVGPPGCGKTRLALEVVKQSSKHYPAAIPFVNLAPVHDPIAVIDTVAAAVGVPVKSTAELAATIGTGELIVLVDNAEHVIDAIGNLVRTLLAACDGLRILVTSRQPLNIDGEVCWPVQPLELPPPDIGDLNQQRSYDAIALFCTRATERLPSFRHNESNAAVVARICRRLDGIPLALELAAARVSGLGLPEIANRIDESFNLLSGDRPSAVSHHQTLRSALQWSHDLLHPRERLLFRRLALFPGTFDLAAVEALCVSADLPEVDIAATLAALVDKSLIVAHPRPDGSLRYSELQVIRLYGREQAAHAEYSDQVARHARYYARLADEMSQVGADFEARVESITAEYPNMEAALDWAASESHSMHAAITEHLYWYWMLRGMINVALRHLESVLSRDGLEASTAARLCLLASTAAYRAADHEAMHLYAERASKFTEQTSDPWLRVWIAASQGLLAVQQGGWEAAEVLFRRLIDLSARLPANPHHEPVRMHGWPPIRARQLMVARNNLALTLIQLGRNEEAACEAELALEAAMEVSERSISIATILHTCGHAYLALSRTKEARARFTASLSQAVANLADHFAVSPLIGLSCTAAADGDYSACLTFAAAARRAAMSSDTPNWIEGSDQVKSLTSAEQTSRAALGESLASKAWERGAMMDSRRALEFLRSYDSPSQSPLTPRELEIARLVARGLADKEIAHCLAISSRTVEVHLAHIRQKLGSRNRAEVAVWAASQAPAD